VVLVVMKMHRLFIDGGLKRVVVIREGRHFVGHTFSLHLPTDLGLKVVLSDVGQSLAVVAPPIALGTLRR
jgi:hypothetical protein